MMSFHRAHLSILLAALLAQVAGCKKDDISTPHEGDAEPIADIEPPTLLGVPERTPLTSVAARGTTEGSRVVTISPSGTLVTVALPGGTFCQDTPITTDTPNQLKYYAMSGDGRISEPTVIEVTYDESAPEPTPASCTGGTDQCPGDEEVCGSDDEDEDCNGWADQCDIVCSGCDDDVYEPNDLPINVPSLPAGSYDLELCPCRDDWFAFPAGPGDRVHAVADFVHASIDIDLKLYISGPEGSGYLEPAVASSSGTDDQEEIDWTVPTDMGGTFFLRVFPFNVDDKPAGSYTLTTE